MSSALPRTHLTRREAILAGAAAAVTTALSSSPLALAASSPLSRSTYVALTDHRFLGRLRGTTVRRSAFELVEVADLPRAATLAKYRGSDNAFGLLFDGPLGGRQGIHMLDHPLLGRINLFLTPVGRPSTVQRYEAIIDRLYRPTAANPAPTGSA
jgi:hypothetical protein